MQQPAGVRISGRSLTSGREWNMSGSYEICSRKILPQDINQMKNLISGRVRYTWNFELQPAPVHVSNVSTLLLHYFHEYSVPLTSSVV
jgi:hypothetical protein